MAICKLNGYGGVLCGNSGAYNSRMVSGRDDDVTCPACIPLLDRGADSLFDIPESLSPRLAWLDRYTIALEYCEEDDGWVAHSAQLKIKHAGYGDTEDDALAAFAKCNGLDLWIGA